MDHFQNMASGAFIVKRLEKPYGKDLVQIGLTSMAMPVKANGCCTQIGLLF